jgi:hypothetical protein
MVAADFALYKAGSVQFAYPSNWSVESQDAEEGVSVALQSQGVSFVIVGVYPGEQEPADLADQTLAALREEHPSLDAEEDLDDLTSDAVAMEISLLSLDVFVQCWLRSWRVGSNTVLVLLQSVERESERCYPVFRAICHSLRSTDESDEG